MDKDNMYELCTGVFFKPYMINANA